MKKNSFFYRKIEIDMVVVIVVDDGAVAGSVVVCFFRCSCCWLLMVGRVCLCVMRVWKSLYNSFMVLFTSFVQYFDTTKPRTSRVCFVSSCVPFLSFSPRCVLTVCCTTQFSLFTYTCLSFTRKKERQRRQWRWMQCICFRRLRSACLSLFILYMVCTAAEHKFLLQFFLLGLTHISFIYYDFRLVVRAEITRRKDKNETKKKKMMMKIGHEYKICAHQTQHTRTTNIQTHFKPNGDEFERL